MNTHTKKGFSRGMETKADHSLILFFGSVVKNTDSSYMETLRNHNNMDIHSI